MSKQPGSSPQFDCASSRTASNDFCNLESGHSEIMSMHDEIVRYTASSSSFEPERTLGYNDERQATLVLRLEQELTQAQICNHRLNQQLKTLANNNDKAIKVELANTKKQLNCRVNDVEELKKSLDKLKAERIMWLSKQPQDVNALLAEKQELRKQLDREQNEKQELFMQINSMIAKLADSEDQEEINRLKSEVSKLRKELDVERTSYQTETAKLQVELQKAKQSVADSLKDGDKEKESMEQEIENLQQQLAIKAASLQSLMLAKPNTSENDKTNEENESLKIRIQSLQKKFDDLKHDVGTKNAEISNLKDAISMNDMTRQNMSSLQEKLSNLNSLLDEEKQQKSAIQVQSEKLKSALLTSEDTLSKLKLKLNQFEESATSLKNENEVLRQAQKEATLFDSSRIKELTQMISDEKDNTAILNVQLREKDGKIDRIQVELLAAESRAREAEEEVKVIRKSFSKPEGNDEMGQKTESLKLKLAQIEKNYVLAQEENSSLEASIHKKDAELLRLTTLLNESQQTINRSHDDHIKETTAKKEQLDDLSTQNSQNQLKIVKLEKRVEELLNDSKTMESKTSVADEINTLMSSLNSVREENNEYEEEVRRLESQIRSLQDDLYQNQDKIALWKEKAEKAENDSESRYKRTQELESTHSTEISRIRDEKKELEMRLEKAEVEMDNARREASDLVATAKRNMTEASINADRQIRDLNEKVDSLTRELEFSKQRMERLQDDQCKFIGTQDEMKSEMVQKLTSFQEDIEKKTIEIIKLNEKNAELEKKCAEHASVSEELKTELDKSEKKIEKMKMQLSAAEDLSDRLQEAQILSGNVESMFSELQTDNKTKMEKMIDDHKKTVEELQSTLKKCQMEQVSLESVIEDQQQELIRQSKECEVLQDQLRENAKIFPEFEEMKRNNSAAKDYKKEIEKKLQQHEYENTEYSKTIQDLELKVQDLVATNKALVTNCEKLESSLQVERKKSDDFVKEKQQIEHQVEALQSSIKNEQDQNDVSELTAENVRLAGELLKMHSLSEKNLALEKERMSKFFEERLKNANLEKTRLAAELQITESQKKQLESRAEDLQVQLNNSEKRRGADIRQLDYLREELLQMKNNNEKLKSSTPIAPPRSSTRTISNMSAMTNWTQADFSDCEDLTRLRSEIDKQKRLIIVLRRKLQGLQQ